jgi:hypothetical protein
MQSGERRLKENAAGLISALLLIALSVNPVTEKIDGTNAIVFMFSHYALFLAGFLISFRVFRTGRYMLIAGTFLAAIWHLPVPFAISGASAAYRLLEEIAMIAAGFLIGSSVGQFSSFSKSILFALWIAGDTALSVVFILFPEIYSHSDLPVSPFPPGQFVILGVLMVFFMNSVIAAVVYLHVRRFGNLLSDLDE